MQLSCEQCKRKKTKCDKRVPCSACRAGSLECHPVQRARLPRGRTGKVKKRNVVLEDKVAKLEGLLHRLESHVNNDGRNVDLNANDVSNGDSGSQRQPNKVENLAAHDFWVALSNEVSGLRETLEDSEQEDTSNAAIPETLLDGADPEIPSTGVLFPHSPSSSSNATVTELTVLVRRRLLEIYCSRVDTIFKVLHWPTILELLNERDVTKSSASRALESAIYFMAACATTTADCEALSIDNRPSFIKSLRYATEQSLSAAQLLTTNDLVVLQAFVIYLTGLRCCMEAPTTWTLLALAVRIAESCGARPKNPPSGTPFDHEQQRRVWFGIGLLDSQTSFGRGSIPLLSHEDLLSPPRDINDSDMSPIGVQAEGSSSFTDMTFSSLCHHAMVCQRKLCNPFVSLWQDRLDIVAAFELFVNRQFGQFEFSLDPLQRYTANGARDMAINMNLLLRRPPYKKTGESVPTSDDFDIMGMACRVVQSGLFKQTHAEYAPYRWFSWPKWYALAVLLVELLRGPGGPAHDRAYSIAQQSFTEHAQSASEARQSSLWKPISKLMRQLERIKSTGIAAAGDFSMGNSSMAANSTRFDGPRSVSTTLPSHTNSKFDFPVTALPQNYESTVIQALPWFDWEIFLDEVNNPVDTSMDFAVSQAPQD